jgi:hypothetical protein
MDGLMMSVKAAARGRLLIWSYQKSRLEYVGSRYYHVDKPREKREMNEG